MAGPWEKYANGGQVVQPNPVVVQGKQADLANTQAGTARTRQQMRADEQMLPYQVQKAQADAAKAKAEADRARQQPTADPKVAQRVANLRALEAQIGRVKELYSKGPGATKGIAGALDYLPTPSNKQFDVAGAGLGELGLSAFRVPGVGSQSDAELRAFVQANRPSSSDYDTEIMEKLRNLQNRVGETYSAMGMRPAKQKSRKPSASKVIDFNDLPE